MCSVFIRRCGRPVGACGGQRGRKGEREGGREGGRENRRDQVGPRGQASCKGVPVKGKESDREERSQESHHEGIRPAGGTATRPGNGPAGPHRAARRQACRLPRAASAWPRAGARRRCSPGPRSDSALSAPALAPLALRRQAGRLVRMAGNRTMLCRFEWPALL